MKKLKSKETHIHCSFASSSTLFRTSTQATGRAQPSREDKNEFLNALGASAAGQPTVPMLYFYKYLLKHGEEDGMPQLDKDLFFYIEVQKFKVRSKGEVQGRYAEAELNGTADNPTLFHHDYEELSAGLLASPFSLR
jgi:hypothetical protein